MSFLSRADSHVWSTADQVLVSGCNFAVGVLLARLLGLEAFGVYAIAQMYLMYANTFQQSLVSAPMMTAVPSESNAALRANMLRGFFGYSLLVQSVITLLVLGVAWLLGGLFSSLDLHDVIFPLALAMVGFQLQDWLRRVLYVQCDNRSVFASDAIAYGGQLVALIVLAWYQQLTIATALGVFSISFGASAVFIVLKQRLLPSWACARQVMQAHGLQSRDMFISSQLQWLASSGVVLIGATFVGAQAAGAIRAAQNLLGPVNVIFQWMENVIPVRAAIRYREIGRDGLVKYLSKIGWIGCMAIAAFAVLLATVDEMLITTVYGEAYRAFAILLVFQAIYYLFGHAYRMLSYFNRVTGDTATLAKASVWWVVVSVLVALLAVQAWADRGIMVALIMGEVAALSYLFWVLFSQGKLRRDKNA